MLPRQERQRNNLNNKETKDRILEGRIKAFHVDVSFSRALSRIRFVVRRKRRLAEQNRTKKHLLLNIKNNFGF